MNSPHRRRSLLAALGLASLVAAGPAAVAASATVTPEPSHVVGGAALATTGVVTSRVTGVPRVPAVSAAGFVLADLDSGEVLAAKNPHGRFAPASTLKALTALTLVPKLDPASLVTATFDDANVDGSKVGIVPKGRYTVEELFQAMMMVSGNDAALTLADANGGVAKTVADMNERAREIGAFDTVAKTPNGLDAKGQVSSAYDLAVIARHGLALPAFARYVSMRKSSFGAEGARAFEIYTHNKLVLRYKGAFGVKNGYTVAARASFVGAAERNGHRLVVSLMRADPTVWKEAASLLDWGFAQRAGLRPVGTLDAVSTGAAPEPGGEAVSPASKAASTAPRGTSGGGIPIAPAAAATGVIAGFLALRRVARRPHRGGKLRLPPI